jgi:hypothetical protein
MALDRVGRFPVEEDRQIFGPGDLISQASPTTIAIGPSNLLRLAVLDVLEDHLVVAQRRSPPVLSSR